MRGPEKGPGRPGRAARRAVTAVFLLNGAVFAAWVPRIPEVKSALGLGDAALGAALAGPALGSIGAMAVTGALVARYGSRPVTRAALTAFCVPPVLIGLAGSWAALFAVLTAWGAAVGCLDVAMNSAGMAVQERYGRPIMSGLHASFSGGALLGAAGGAAAAHLGVPVAWHLGVTAAAALAAGLAATRALLPAGADAQAGGPAFARPTRPLLLLSALAFAALLSEGAAGDWSAVYLRDVLDAGPGAAGAGYMAFAVTMTAGRLAGDRLVTRFGPVRVVRVLAAVAAAGFGAGLLAGHPVPALAGLAALGLGLACVVPVVFTAAAHAGGAPGPAIAAVSTCGYLGFIAGPPLIGAAAEAAGLAAALGIVAALAALVAAAAGAVGPAAAVTAPPRPPRPRPGGDGTPATDAAHRG
ncbi:MFS transporter [Actinomadura graeca]|uniref:MFS transporter n=1 Tax=Actinomadura graeca TaxID=2750812 RepID=A0ABX8QMC1_9ACTN|nr:MFS transporter [Actinomadura graeca]QXJ19874.1 MFS transporter [Actinomadura graeca]